MTVLSVNLNKIAVLRNSRGEDEPDIGRACDCVIAAGAGGITVHPRPDQRHVRPDDVRALNARIARRVEFNIEGNAFAPPRGDYPGLIALVREVRPEQVTLVPDSDAQITSDHGFDLAATASALRPIVAELRSLGARVSLFVDAGDTRMDLAAALGADRVEIYTGPFAKAFAAGDVGAELARCVATAQAARAAGLGVNAGHDLSQANLGCLVNAIPFLAEVSIGHALIGEALYDGLATTVRNYRRLLGDA
ncbi:MAG: pyridoxine 5'-phosphate synthase [Lysobacterales bacterium 69-70]|nr:pyridoxine 5'-phosphate synthase [Xanthomonadaceae bacterium]ODU32645.1 MAG: pyridoxine 5'-phosphate synthase [Xanthomonadaceae bacterium SCN 69-320]ODV19156.1 MAG: pyridoxine 5'-phosphate synthase [Xanthomonadaceae bacterium SCN 69-25]OJY99637.1 MAG: pyridoxine 5'-phosphate synthase [Xanthomonadales bacterium 69-70]